MKCEIRNPKSEIRNAPGGFTFHVSPITSLTMPGFLLHQGATVLCLHGGQAQATVSNPRVKVAGQMTVQQPNPWTVAACPFTTGSSPQPCVTAQWITAATRVKSAGQPLLLQDSQATCVPNGTGVNVVNTQTRVRAQ